MEEIKIKLTPATVGAAVIEKTTTDPTYLFEQLDHDTYQLQVTSQAYNTLNEVIILDDNKTVNLTLTPKVIEPVITWEAATRTRVKPFDIIPEENENLLPSESYTRQQGSNGEEAQTYEQKYVDGFPTSEERNVGQWIVTRQPVNQINVIGTKEAEATNLLNNDNVFSVGSNNLLYNGVPTQDPLNISYQEIYKWESDGRIRWFMEMAQAHTPYTIAFKIRKESGDFNAIGGYLGHAWETAIQKVFKDGVEVSGNWQFDQGGYPLSNTTDTQTYVLHLTTTGDVGAMNEFTIQPNPTTHAEVTYFIEDIGLYQGHIEPFGVNVKQFGAMGDGVTNDTSAIAQALSVHNTINIPAGVFLIDADVSLKPRNNTKIYMDSQTVLKTIPNASTHYELFDLIDKENITISGGTLIGDRDAHQGTEGEWGHGINMRGVKNITIRNLKSQDFWGDGIYLGISVATGNTNRNVRLDNVHCDNNRRQGLSVVTVDGLYGDNVTLSNTNGTLPEAGVDFEPNNSNEPLDNIYFNNLTTYGNAGSGILFHLANLTRNNHSINAVFNNFKSDGDRIGLNLDKFNGEANGQVVFNNPSVKRSKVRGIGFRGFSSKFSKIILNDPIVEDSNRDGLSSVAEGSPISIFRSSADYPEDSTFTMGNIEINNPQVSFTGGSNPLQYDMVFWSGTANPEKQFERMSIQNNNHRMIFGVQNLRDSSIDVDGINYIYDYWTGASPVEFNLPENNRVTPIIKIANNKQCTVRLMKVPNDDYPYEFIVEHTGNSGAYPMYIRPPAGETMSPANYANGLMVVASASGTGSKVKIGRENGKWKVVEVTGSWVAI